jgi:hypothetical protein
MPVYLVRLWKADDKIDVAIASLIDFLARSEGVRVHGPNGQTSVTHQHVCQRKALVLAKRTYGGLLVRSVFKMTGTLVISVTSWIYSPPTSRSLK